MPNSKENAVDSVSACGLSICQGGGRTRCLVCGAVVCLLFYVIAYLVSLGVRPMVRPDEFRYAEIPREMLARGDWIAPRLLDFRYFEKPALGYQLIALSFALWGENSFALRLPGALGTGFSAAMLFVLFALRTKRAILAPLATLIFLSFGLVRGVGAFAVLDAPFSAGLTVSMVSCFLAISATSSRERTGWLVLTGVGAGVAFLIKGFLGFVIPGLVVAPFLLLWPQKRAFFRHLWLPVLVGLGVALPWSVMIHLREPDFWNYFVFVEHFQRFTSSTNDSSQQPIWYFIPVLLAGVLPSGFLIFLTRGAWNRAFLQTPLCRFLMAGAVLPFVFFSISSSKLGTYILPCFPFLAGLLALALEQAFSSRSDAAQRVFVRFGKIWGWTLLALVVGGFIFWSLQKSLWAHQGPPLSVLLVLGIWGWLLLACSARPLWVRGLILVFGVAVVFATGPWALPTVRMQSKAPEAVLKRFCDELQVQPDDTVYVDVQAMHAVAWTLKRSQLQIVGGMGELVWPLTTFPEYEMRFFAGIQDVLLESTPPGKSVLIFLNRRQEHERLLNMLPFIAHAEAPKMIAIRF